MKRRYRLTLAFVLIGAFLIFGLRFQLRPARADSFQVINTNDDTNPGSLRWAIMGANAVSGSSTITFAIPGTGVQTIALQSALPTITHPISIDATQQTGAACPTTSPANNATLLIQIDGTNAGANSAGLTLSGGNSTVKGLVITGFNGAGIILTGTGGDSVTCNFIGVSATGTTAAANGYGVLIMGGANNNTIGGTTADAANLISGNTHDGVQINGTNGNTVSDNLIGTNAAGTAALGNGNGADSGVYITGTATGNRIGGTSAGARNTISGNFYGVRLNGAGVTGNTVAGNYIGMSAAGTAALGNANIGVFLQLGAANNTIGGTNAGAGNTISNNGQAGIFITGAGTSGNVIQGNLIGTDPTGTLNFGNVFSGIYIELAANGNIIGGSAAGARNVISGNQRSAVFITGTGTNNNQVIGNYLGTNASGTVAIANALDGVHMTLGAASATISGNLISGNHGVGVYLAGVNNNVVTGNRIGTNAAGTAAIANGDNGVYLTLGATGNLIGGTAAGAGNLISGNTLNGVYITSTSTNGNTVQGNLIGTDATGTSALPNHGNGIAVNHTVANNTIGGSAAGAGNVISGNSGYGLYISDAGTTGNVFNGNLIGTTASGTASLSNSGGGVRIEGGATGNIIGGTTVGNTISGNGGYGISISGTNTNNNTIEDNRIGTNGSGTGALPNNGIGVVIQNGASHNQIGVAGAGNLISGNVGFGINITGSGTTLNSVQANLIGLNIDSSAALPNTNGIQIDSSSPSNLIGGMTAGQGNVIARNTGKGIVVRGDNTFQNAIYGNAIYGNSFGIDLGDDGVTANHPNNPATGPNKLQNYPVITGAVQISPTAVNLSGTLNSGLNTVYRIEVFSSTACDATNFGQGQTYLTALNVTTNASGAASFTQSLSVPAGQNKISATATDPNGNTSEFSACVTTTPPFHPDTIGVYDNGVFYLRNSNSAGPADITVPFDPYNAPVTNFLPVVGDWNHDGVDTIGVYDKTVGVFLLRDSNTPGPAQYAFVMGNPGDEPIAGHWDSLTIGSGVGVYRPSNGLLYVKRTLATGYADYTMVLGNPGDHGIAGDWDGNGFDSVGVWRPGNTMFYLANALGGTTQLPAIIFSDYNFVFGPASLTPLAGDWTGSGTSHVGYTLNGTVSLRYTDTAGPADNTFAFGSASAHPVAGKWIAGGLPASQVNNLIVPGTSVSPTPTPQPVQKPAATSAGDGLFD